MNLFNYNKDIMEDPRPTIKTWHVTPKFKNFVASKNNIIHKEKTVDFIIIYEVGITSLNIFKC